MALTRTRTTHLIMKMIIGGIHALLLGMAQAHGRTMPGRTSWGPGCTAWHGKTALVTAVLYVDPRPGIFWFFYDSCILIQTCLFGAVSWREVQSWRSVSTGSYTIRIILGRLIKHLSELRASVTCSHISHSKRGDPILGHSGPVKLPHPPAPGNWTNKITCEHVVALC